MNTLIDILRQYAEKQPEKLFAADINGCITYEQAWKNAVNVASRLKNDFRINRGDRVLIQCNQSIEYLFQLKTMYQMKESEKSQTKLNAGCL